MTPAARKVYDAIGKKRAELESAIAKSREASAAAAGSSTGGAGGFSLEDFVSGAGGSAKVPAAARAPRSDDPYFVPGGPDGRGAWWVGHGRNAVRLGGSISVEPESDFKPTPIEARDLPDGSGAERPVILDADLIDNRAKMQEFFADTFRAGIRTSLEGGDVGEAIRSVFADRITSAMEESINRMADLLAGVMTEIFSGLGGQLSSSAGSILSSVFFGGARASGGPVTAGRMYRVNEMGQEAFMPSVNGQIISAQALAAQRSVSPQVRLEIYNQGEPIRADQSQGANGTVRLDIRKEFERAVKAAGRSGDLQRAMGLYPGPKKPG